MEGPGGMGWSQREIQCRGRGEPHSRTLVGLEEAPLLICHTHICRLHSDITSLAAVPSWPRTLPPGVLDPGVWGMGLIGGEGKGGEESVISVRYLTVSIFFKNMYMCHINQLSAFGL